MNGFLLDTNVLSELRKRERCDESVRRWFETVANDLLFTSVLVIGEMRRGVEIRRRKDPLNAAHLESWVNQLLGSYSSRVLPVDLDVAEVWGKWSAIRTLPVEDGLIAATAFVHQLTLVTRNEKDVHGLEVSVLNPWRG